MLDTHRPKSSINPFNTDHGVPHLCHNKCSAGKQKLLDGLQEISEFMTQNPNEVIIIIFEDKIRDANGNLKPEKQRVLATHIKEIMDKVALTQYVYTYDDTKGWPTLGEMIKSNKRLVIMSEAQGYKNGKDPAPFAWYHHIWSLVKETEYSFGSVDKFKEEGKYICRPNQKRGGPETNGVFLINHWVTWLGSAESDAHKANSILLERARECAKARKSTPTIVAVDFLSIYFFMLPSLASQRLLLFTSKLTTSSFVTVDTFGKLEDFFNHCSVGLAKVNTATSEFSYTSPDNTSIGDLFFLIASEV